jgi:hypothetical protein
MDKNNQKTPLSEIWRQSSKREREPIEPPLVYEVRDDENDSPSESPSFFSLFTGNITRIVGILIGGFLLMGGISLMMSPGNKTLEYRNVFASEIQVSPTADIVSGIICALLGLAILFICFKPAIDLILEKIHNNRKHGDKPHVP